MNPWSKPPDLDELSTEPYGVGLAACLWNEFMITDKGQGIYAHHRDYCGIGLVRTLIGVALYQSNDGDPFDQRLLHWNSCDAFVDYWSRQSDYGLSGADPSHPELLARSDFEINNQRINRERICNFLDRSRNSTGRTIRGWTISTSPSVEMISSSYNLKPVSTLTLASGDVSA